MYATKAEQRFKVTLERLADILAVPTEDRYLFYAVLLFGGPFTIIAVACIARVQQVTCDKAVKEILDKLGESMPVPLGAVARLPLNDDPLRPPEQAAAEATRVLHAWLRTPQGLAWNLAQSKKYIQERAQYEETVC